MSMVPETGDHPALLKDAVTSEVSKRRETRGPPGSRARSTSRLCRSARLGRLLLRLQYDFPGQATTDDFAPTEAFLVALDHLLVVASAAEQFPSAQTDRLRSMRAVTRNAGQELIEKDGGPPN